MPKDTYFFCYNKRVSDYLQQNGLHYITVARDPKTNKLFSLYKQTPELSRLLTQYKNSKR